MASNYPAAIDAYVDKTDGFDDVMAAHVNSLQDAMSAVQNTLGLNPQGISADVAAAIADAAAQAASANAASTLLASGAADGQKLIAYSAATGKAKFIDDDFGASFLLGDGQNVLSTGIKGFVRVPYDCIIESVALAADAVGSCVVNILKSTPPTQVTAGTGICSATQPTLSSAQSMEDTALASWTKQLAKGDYLTFNVVSASTVKLVTVAITGRKNAVS